MAGPLYDGDVTVVIGAADGDAGRRQRLQRGRRRVAVVVVQPDADDADLWVHRSEVGGVEVGTAVVPHLQNLGPQVDTGGEHRPLRLHLGVRRQQHAQAADGRPDDH